MQTLVNGAVNGNASDRKAVQINSDGSLPAGGFTKVVDLFQNGVSENAYSANMCMGGVKTVECVRNPGGTAILQSFAIYDYANQKPTGTLFVFKSVATSFIIDRSEPNFHRDCELVAVIPVVAADYTTFSGSTTSVAFAAKTNIGAVLQAPADSKALKFVFVLTNAPAFAGEMFKMSVGLLQD